MSWGGRGRRASAALCSVSCLTRESPSRTRRRATSWAGPRHPKDSNCRCRAHGRRHPPPTACCMSSAAWTPRASHRPRRDGPYPRPRATCPVGSASTRATCPSRGPARHWPPNHVHHGHTVRWFLDHRAQAWATTPLTETGFVRISSNRLVVPEAKRPAEAILLLRQLTALEGYVFWPDDVPFTRSDLIAVERIVGHRQVTDAHLVGLALRHQGKVATFDRGLAAVLPAGVDVGRVVVVLG